jgi:hypothetical protein
MPINLPDYADNEEERKLEAEYKAMRKILIRNCDPSVLDKMIMKKVIPALKEATKKRVASMNLF